MKTTDKALIEQLDLMDAYEASGRIRELKNENAKLKKQLKKMRVDDKTLQICLNIAYGCHNYQGGHHDERDNEIYHHGIQTVINCLERLVKDKDLSDTQLNIVHSIGARS